MRKKKYTEHASCSITSTMKQQLRKVKAKKNTTYAALIREALGRLIDEDKCNK